MIKCSACGADTKMLTCRDGADGSYTRRRRECLTCHERMTTTEVIIEDRSTANVMLVPVATMETLLRSISSAFAPADSERAAALIGALLGRSKP